MADKKKKLDKGIKNKKKSSLIEKSKAGREEKIDKAAKKKGKKVKEPKATKPEKKLKKGKVEKAGKKSKGDKPAKKAKKIIANEAKPIKSKLTRAQTLEAIIQGADLPEVLGKKIELSERQEKKVVKAVMESLENQILGSIHKNGIGTFTFGNLFKIVTKKVDAKPRRKGINPFTKEEQWFEAKPATVRVKARPMKRLKDAAL